MKKLLILLFSILISFNSYGEWTEMGLNSYGDSHYIDSDRIKEKGGYVYFWAMTDYLKPDEYGTLSNEMYFQGDCGVKRFKVLSFIFYTQPMGNGEGESGVPVSENADWDYVSPGSIIGDALNLICDYVD